MVGLGVCSHESEKGEKNCNGKTNTREETQGYYYWYGMLFQKNGGRCSGKGKKGHLVYTNLPTILYCGISRRRGDHGGLEWVNGWRGRF